MTDRDDWPLPPGYQWITDRAANKRAAAEAEAEVRAWEARTARRRELARMAAVVVGGAALLAIATGAYLVL